MKRERAISLGLALLMAFGVCSGAAAGQYTGYQPGNTTGYAFEDGEGNVRDYGHIMENFLWDEPFDVNDDPIPAEHLANAEEYRTAARDMQFELRTKVNQWKNSGKADTVPASYRGEDNTYTIRSGVYRFVDVVPIQMTDVKNFHIVAEPDTFIYLETNRKSVSFENRVVVLKNCANVSITGDEDTLLVTDCIPFNSTQGVISDVDATKGARVQFTWSIQKGYVGYDGDLLAWIGGKQERNYKMFKPDGTAMPNSMINTRSITHLGGNQYRVEVDSSTYNEYLYNGASLLTDAEYGMFAEGNYMALRFDLGSGLSFDNSGNITIGNFAYYGGDFFIGEYKSTASNFFINCRGARREGSGRLMGVAGSQQTYLSGAPYYKNCEFGYTWDDLINVCDWGIVTYRQESPREVIIFPKGNEGFKTFEGAEGKLVEFFDFDSMEKTDEGRIVSVEKLYDPSLTKAFTEAMSDKNYVPITGTLVRVTFDRDMDVGLANIVKVEDRHPTDAIFEGCYMHDGTCRLLLNGTSRIRIKDCIIERTALTAISLEMSTYWLEGATSNDILIEDSLIIDGRRGMYGMGSNQSYTAAIVISTEASSDAPMSYAHERIEIRGNTIVDADGAAILVGRSRDVYIHDNLFINSAAGRYAAKTGRAMGRNYYGEDSASSVYLHSVKNAVVENNITKDSPALDENTAYRIGKKTLAADNIDEANIVMTHNIVNGQPAAEIIRGIRPQPFTVQEAVPYMLEEVSMTPDISD